MENLTFQILNIKGVQSLNDDNKDALENYLKNTSFANKLRIFNLLDTYPDTLPQVLNAVRSFLDGESLSLDGILESLKQNAA